MPLWRRWRAKAFPGIQSDMVMVTASTQECRRIPVALGDIKPQDIAIKGDRIAAIGTNMSSTRAKLVVNAEGMWVSPGFIDIHTHVFVGSKAGQFANGINSLSRRERHFNFLDCVCAGLADSLTDIINRFGSTFQLRPPDRRLQFLLAAVCPTGTKFLSGHEGKTTASRECH